MSCITAVLLAMTKAKKSDEYNSHYSSSGNSILLTKFSFESMNPVEREYNDYSHSIKEYTVSSVVDEGIDIIENNITPIEISISKLTRSIDAVCLVRRSGFRLSLTVYVGWSRVDVRQSNRRKGCSSILVYLCGMLFTADRADDDFTDKQMNTQKNK